MNEYPTPTYHIDCTLKNNHHHTHHNHIPHRLYTEKLIQHHPYRHARFPTGQHHILLLTNSNLANPIHQRSRDQAWSYSNLHLYNSVLPLIPRSTNDQRSSTHTTHKPCWAPASAAAHCRATRRRWSDSSRLLTSSWWLGWLWSLWWLWWLWSSTFWILWGFQIFWNFYASL